MDRDKEFALWVASIDRGDLGYTYLRFYTDAPEWVKNHAVNRFGRGTVFLRPLRRRPRAA
ncbi:MAG: hypothetical protein WCA32_09260 [Chromatiaceae bacterium]